jgi:HKD family nuclease
MAKPISFLKASPKGKSVLFGAPDDFDFMSILRDAVSIKCAIAFGHMSGWRQIDLALRDSRAKSISILLGRAFFQTEPDLLDQLLVKEQRKKSFQGRLAPSAPTFHPKVWMIETSATTHVIVGSANLSHGGFMMNTECSIYTDDVKTTESISGWFREQWDDSSPLTPGLCEIYREQFNRTKAQRSALRKAIDAATEGLEAAQIAWRRSDAIEAARLYFKTPEGMSAAMDRLEAMDRIRKCLKPPAFEFTKTDWLNFLGIPEFGDLKRINRDTAKQLPSIRRAFLHLADENVPLAERIENVVPPGGRFHVDGIGKNVVTKVMAMLSPKKRPVYNEPVAKTLNSFGYPLGLSRTFGEHYDAFCREVQSFVKECGLSEVLSVDSFFEYYSHEHKKR